MLRLFGAQSTAVGKTVENFPPQWRAAAQWKSRGAETLVALQAQSPSGLKKAAQALRQAFSADLYGAGETTLPAAVVEALERHDKLFICADAAAGALLEARLENLPGAEKVFDFGAVSYANPKTGPLIEKRARARLPKDCTDPLRQALARAQAARRVVGADLSAACAERDIALSVHAPYYISMSSLEEDKRLHRIDYLLQSCALVKALGGRRVIFHAGSCGKQSREAALEKALDTMRRAVQAVDEAGYGDCILCPETMGKVNQLGTLDEVLALCSVDERMIPCVDFGHLYARSQGTGLNDETAPADYAAILDAIAAALPGERAKKFHAHFSRIAYTKGGEKCHLTFADTEYGPPHAPLLALLKERGLTPTIICESAGTQAEDAAELAKTYAAL